MRALRKQALAHSRPAGPSGVTEGQATHERASLIPWEPTARRKKGRAGSGSREPELAAVGHAEHLLMALREPLREPRPS